ncbi:lysine biosynthesis protein LysW [Candidatus Falkowbacteria bacterium CG_4_9_14_3_um_filter_38_19]|uniref:Lysine biosynthesis protein LysW n=2 Tax=Candidatus Falkowiibacteriota TaxID=1752728 RepID=A0A2M6WQ62_9BACT|nr:lysine biosynthesis protein LysW [Candidatus Falkowbacteria bacterium]PIT94929.1 MAG: lysine biosynthesis protein LysW [Candidatus Falkowbacteria bacterium CG10_big_fil_rev_8_21_14_0_10_38_22]PJB16611.1 MAG: lysine biosynthesis protein LysW [Candidatus Falkowbacteria bacterium CG_4_9_14_3_um_filter_38_19]
MKTNQCPICSSDVIIDDESNEGDLVTCANCGNDLEIISLKPLQLARLSEEDELSKENEQNEN